MGQLGAAIRRRRRELGLTLARLAEGVGCSKAYLSAIENDRTDNPPSRRLLERLEAGLAVASGELVRRTVNAVIRDDITEAERSAEFVQQLYGQMLEFDLRNGLLRKKVDGMKYAVQKVQDVLYDVHLRRDMDG